MSTAVDEALAPLRSVEGDPRGEQWYKEITQAGNGTHLEQLAARWSDDTRANARAAIFELLSKGGALIGGLVLLYFCMYAILRSYSVWTHGAARYLVFFSLASDNLYHIWAYLHLAAVIARDLSRERCGEAVRAPPLALLARRPAMIWCYPFYKPVSSWPSSLDDPREVRRLLALGAALDAADVFRRANEQVDASHSAEKV